MATPLPLESIHHIARETRDVERCTRFYTDVLGFHSIRRPNFHFGGAWLFGYGVQIHVIEGEPPRRGSAVSSRVDHVAFHTKDIAVVEALLREHKINYLRNVQGPTGMIQLFFHDPDGNHIEVASYPPLEAPHEDVPIHQ